MPLILATTTPGKPEIFASLQGEGPSTGKPCAFIRLSRCNLACTWCDTPYTWLFTGDNRPHRDGVTYDRAANQVTLPEAEAAQIIRDLNKPRLVITGGEPLLQAAGLSRMLVLLPGMQIEVETNGTVAPSADIDPFIAQYTVSPKLPHSGNSTELALRARRLHAWAKEPRAAFKFVVATPDDVAEVMEIMKQYSLPQGRVWLMAEGTDAATLESRERWLSELCIEHNLTLSKRLHIHLFGDTRGT